MVYRAYDPRVDREVAIKVMPRELLADPQFQVRFTREVKMIAKLEHPAIVPIYDVGEIDGQPYYVMRLMPGGTLSDWIKKGSFSIEDTARIIERIAAGLSYAHKKGVIHRDIKPGNILFDQNGDPYLSDFGIAKFTEAAENVTGSAVVGTPAYMSPEQAQSTDIDGRSDVYGLGAIVYEMLSGTQPYSAETPMGVVIKHITDPVPEILDSNPNLPKAIDMIIKKAMAKDRDERFQSTTDLSKALNAIAKGDKVPSSAPEPAPAKERGGSKKFVLPGVIGLVVIAALVGFFLFRNSSPANQAPPATEAAAPAPVESPAPTEEAPTLAPTAPAEQFAPLCQASPSTCTAPQVEEVDKFCTNKVPYTLLAMPENSTFESLSPEMICNSEGIRGGNLNVTCRGPELISFDLKICNPSCSQPTLVEDSNQCQAGYGFDAANGCCAPLPPAVSAGTEEAGCIIFQVDLRQCN